MAKNVRKILAWMMVLTMLAGQLRRGVRCVTGAWRILQL